MRYRVVVLRPLTKRLSSFRSLMQWMVLDTKLFTPGQALVPNTFWVLDQMPGNIAAADMSGLLQSQGYFSSFNVPFFPSIFNVSGQWALVSVCERTDRLRENWCHCRHVLLSWSASPLFHAACRIRSHSPIEIHTYHPHGHRYVCVQVEQYGGVTGAGAYFSWNYTVRHNIFARDAPGVTDIDGMKKIMRYNDFQHDPLSTQVRPYVRACMLHVGMCRVSIQSRVCVCVRPERGHHWSSISVVSRAGVRLQPALHCHWRHLGPLRSEPGHW